MDMARRRLSGDDMAPDLAGADLQQLLQMLGQPGQGGMDTSGVTDMLASMLKKRALAPHAQMQGDVLPSGSVG